MTGATIGPRKRPFANALRRGESLVRPSAAEVPATTESTQERAATSKLVASERSQEASPKKECHQRSDQACGGRRTKLCSLKASGTTASTGMTIRAARSAAKALVQRPPD